MADEESIEIEIDPIFGGRAKKKLIKDAEKLGDDAGEAIKVGTVKGFKGVTSGISDILNFDVGKEFKNFAKRTAQVLSVAAVALPILLAKRAVEISKTLQNSVLGLSSVASGFGLSVDVVTQKAKDLASDGLVPLEDVSASLKNLLKNFNGDMEKSVEVFDAFKNSAAFNRQGVLSLGEAIKGASEGLKNDLSIKVDNAGITKNLSNMQKEYARSIGTTIGRLTEAQKTQAEYVGVLKEAKITQGDYNKLLTTYEGVTGAASTANRFLLGTLGDIITKSPTLIALIKDNARATRELTKDLKVIENQDPLKPILMSFIDFAGILNDFVVRPVIGLKRVFEIVFQAAVVQTNAVVAATAKLGGALGSIIGFFSKDNALAKGLKDFSESTGEVLKESAEDLVDLGAGLFDPIEIAERGEAFLDNLRTVVSGAKSAVVGGNKEIVSSNDKVKTSLQELQEQWGITFAFVKSKGNELAVNWKNVMKAVKVAAKDGLGKAMGAGFSAFGRALVTGENALKAFGKAFIGAIGAQMVALGTKFILEGAAMVFSFTAGGPAAGAALMGAGAALATAGGAFGAIGSGASAPASGGGVGSPSFDSNATGGEPVLEEAEELRAPDTQVSVVIQGDVFDSDETGTRLVQVLNNAFEKDGVVINGGAVA
jgi:hypothetical protein